MRSLTDKELEHTMSEQSPAASTSLSPDQATEFELTRPDRLDEASLETALDRNRAFAASGGQEGATVFPNLRLLVITCLDPRVDPAHFLGLEIGDAIVIRNGGGRVTPEVIQNIALVAQLAENAMPGGPLFEVALIHHTQCGAGALADDDFRHRYALRIGAEEAVLRERAVVDPAATVARDVELLAAAAAIPSRVAISGHVYDVVTGLVETVIPASARAAGNGSG